MNGIVIARYKEDISWINQIDLTKIKVYIYNKGPKITTLKRNVYYEEIPNLGRESDTYLYHIIKNYNKLEEKIIFTQANFTDHCGSIRKLLDMFNSTLWGTHGYDRHFRLAYWGGNLEREKENLNFGQWMEKYVDKVETNNFRWNVGAIFCVSKNKILSRKIEYYRDTLRPQLQTLNPEVGHYFERAWYYIFNLHQ